MRLQTAILNKQYDVKGSTLENNGVENLENFRHEQVKRLKSIDRRQET